MTETKIRFPIANFLFLKSDNSKVTSIEKFSPCTAIRVTRECSSIERNGIIIPGQKRLTAKSSQEARQVSKTKGKRCVSEMRFNATKFPS